MQTSLYVVATVATMADPCQPRPQVHITAPSNWLNDPNAPLFVDGRWHVYYQYNPDAPQWGLMRWGHVVSPDLRTWTDTGIALHPSPHRADADGAWSGSARIIDGTPIFFYTGARGSGPDHEQSVLRAVAQQGDLTELHPEPDEPVLRIDPSDVGTVHQRDPYLVRRPDGWWMLLGTGLRDGTGGAVALWESQDTFSWRYRGLLFSRPAGQAIESGPVWECPQLMEVDGRWVLLVSVQQRVDDGVRCVHVLWFLGQLSGATFVPDSMGVLDHGDCFYATAVAEGTSRAMLWGWLQDAPASEQAEQPDHVGALSLPRELYVEGSTVCLRPADELELLWTRQLAGEHEPIPADGADQVVAAGLPATYRVRVRDLPEGLAVGVVDEVAGSDESLWVEWTRGARVEVSVTCLDRTHGLRRFSAPLPDDVAAVEVAIIVDGPVVEVFAAGRAFAFRWNVPSGVAVRAVLRGPDTSGADVSVEVAALGSD